jgi:glycine cleavage system aminomethyltransferase T
MGLKSVELVVIAKDMDLHWYRLHLNSFLTDRDLEFIASRIQGPRSRRIIMVTKYSLRFVRCRGTRIARQCMISRRKLAQIVMIRFCRGGHM